MAGTTRLELATSCVTGMRSNQLSYAPIFNCHFSSNGSACQPARLVLPQADTGTSHRLTHLNPRDILTHIKLEDKLFLHFVALFCTRLKVRYHAK